LVYLVLTGLATIYFGWHYLLDDIAGLVIAYVAVRVGAWATGQGVPPTERLEAEEEPVGLPAATEAPLARQPGSRDTRSPVALGAGDSRPPRTHD
jgi:hypothetical protein